MLTITKCYPGVTYLWVIFSIFAEVFQKMFRKLTPSIAFGCKRVRDATLLSIFQFFTFAARI